jgi:hypothetical protein
MPPEGAILDQNLIAHVDARSGDLITTYHRDDEISIRNRQHALRNAVTCMSPNPNGGLAAFSHFTFQGTTYGIGSTNPRAKFDMTVDWAEPTPTGPGAWLWPEGFFFAACSDDLVAFWFLSTPGTARVEKAHFEIRSYSGDPLFVRTLSRADSALFGMVGALGNRIYVASNSTFEIPMIHEFELRKLDP